MGRQPKGGERYYFRFGATVKVYNLGEMGVKGWVEDPSIRAKFKATTANFAKTNGIF